MALCQKGLIIILNFKIATEEQLKTILLHEQCEQHLKVMASKEIMNRGTNYAYKKFK